MLHNVRWSNSLRIEFNTCSLFFCKIINHVRVLLLRKLMIIYEINSYPDKGILQWVDKGSMDGVGNSLNRRSIP